MGEVYRARDTRLGRDVAVKIVPPAVAANPDALGRFERETRAVAALSHPNILTIHDVGRSDGTAYAVLELLEGQTLRRGWTAARCRSARRWRSPRRWPAAWPPHTTGRSPTAI